MTDARAIDARTRADEADVARARAGDTAAFAALVRRHQDRVFGFILRMLDAREEAMELSQDVFVKAWQAAGGNVSRLANLLNVSRVTLYRYLKKYHLEKK